MLDVRETLVDMLREQENAGSATATATFADLMTLEEVAKMTRLPVATLRWYRATGAGGPHSAKLGRRVMYRRADVEAWIAAAFEAQA